MNKQIPSYLKLVTDTTTEATAPRGEDLAALDTLCRAFEQATGWKLEYAAGPIGNSKQSLMWSAPVNPGVGISPGHIRLLSSPDQAAGLTQSPLERAAPLADAVGKLWGELLATRHALWQREAELATGVPLVLHEDDDTAPPLGERLEAVLKGGAEAVGCQAAALYLLDPATTELKLRSSWGLPRKRLTEPARPLRGALADLEALLGHAVVMADERLHDYWKVPEKEFGACVCVPVSSPTMPLGTLWAYCREPRDFSSHETHILEVVAGRLASDLERQVLVDEALSARDQTKQIAAARRSQQEQLPRIAPLVEGWDIAGKVYHPGPVGGSFYDWFALADGGLAVLAGEALQRGVEGAMTAVSLRAAARAFGNQPTSAHALLEKVNSILWTGSGGNAASGLFQAIVAPAGELLSYSAAGPIRVLSLAADRFAPLACGATPLGLLEELRLDDVRRKLSPGELLLVYGTTFLGGCDELMLTAVDERLALALEPCLHLPAGKLVEIAGEILQACPALDLSDRVVLAIKRRRR